MNKNNIDVTSICDVLGVPDPDSIERLINGIINKIDEQTHVS